MKMKERERRRLAGRAGLVFWLFFIVASLLGVRLFGVQVRSGATLAAEAGQEQRASFAVSGRRGDIVDRSGVVFAASVPSSAVFAQPAQIAEPVVEAAELAEVLHQPPARIERELRRKEPFLYLARNLPQPQAKAVDDLGLRGVGTLEEPTGLRVDPQGRTGSTVIGFTGVDDQGLAGVEHAFDDVLRGKPGKVVEDTDSSGLPIPFGRRVIEPAVVGDTVVMTLDRALQFEADDVLARTVAKFHAAGGSLIVMRAATGELLALANWPSYDPAKYWLSPAASWRDPAISDPYEPGSTFKLITATAALDSGKVSLDDRFLALDRIAVGGRVIHNADDGLMASGRGAETLDEIVAYSHNVGAAQVAMRVGKATMFAYIKRFGFDEPTGVDLPGESAGIVGTPDEWWGSRLATIGFGQGVSVTPLSLARAYCAVANGGLLVRPLVVREIVDPAGKVVKVYRPEVVRRVMKPQTATELLAILRHVARWGTAKGVKIPGYAFAGKTGTAQVVIDGAYVPGAYASSFIGIVPADKPQYVVLVKIDRPQGAYYGSIVAAPAFAQVAHRLLWREGVLPKNVSADLYGGPASLPGKPKGQR